MTESSLLSSKLPSSALPHPHTSNDVKMQQAGADATNIIIAAAGQEKDSSLATLQPHTSAASALIIPNHPTKSLKHLPLPSLNPHLTEVNNNSNFESTPPTASPNIMSTKIHHKRQVSKASSISNINGNNNGSGDSGVRKRTKSSLKKSNSSSVGFVAKKGIHEVIQTNNTTAAITGGIVALQSGIAADSNNNENHPQDNNETLLAVGAVNTPNSHQPDSSPTSAVDEVEEDVTDLATRGRTNSDIKRWIKGTQMASVLVQPPIPIMKGGGSGGDGRTRYLAGHNGHGQGDGGGMLGELESDADLLDDGEEHEMMEIHHQQPQHPHHHLYHSYPPPTHHHHNHHSHHHHQRNNNNRHHHQHTANENDGEEEENEGDHVVMSAFDSEIFDPQFDGDDDGNDNSTSHAVRGYHVVKSTSNAGGIREILIEEEEQDESQKKTEIDGKTKKEQKTKREDSKKRGLLRHQKQKDEDIKNHTRKDDSAAAADNDIGG